MTAQNSPQEQVGANPQKSGELHNGPVLLGGTGPAFYIALFRDAPGFVGRLIRWQTRSRYSHAALVFDRSFVFRVDPTAHLFFQRERRGDGVAHCSTCSLITIEAREFRGVRVTEGIVRTEETNVDLFTIRGGISEEQAKRIYFFAKDQIDKGYDYTMVARFISRRQATRAQSDVWFCSELQFAAALKGDVELLRDVEPWEASPGLVGKSPLLDFYKTVGPDPLPELLAEEKANQ